MTTIKNLISAGKEELSLAEIDNSLLEAELFIAHILDCKRGELVLREGEEVSADLEALFWRLINRRKEKEPFAYIVGEAHFHDIVLKITPAVLIPRPETEELVEIAIKEIRKRKGKNLLDLCCGSGCAGLAMKKACPELAVTLSDISTAALGVARWNARALNLDVEFVQGDFLANIPKHSIDILLFNPPYISEEEFKYLDRDVREFEPKRALVSGASALEFYARLAREIEGYLRPNALCLFEVPHGHKEELLELFPKLKWDRREVRLDLAGKERFFLLECQ